MARKSGQSILYTVLLLPTLVIVLSLAIDVGAIEMQQLRIRSALDMATVDAAAVVDVPYYTQTGVLRLDSTQAEAVARQFLYRNLQKLGASIGGDAGAASVVAAARYRVLNQFPARDPFTGQRLDRPAICVEVTVSHRTGLMHWFGLPEEIRLTLHSVAEVRR